MEHTNNRAVPAALYRRERAIKLNTARQMRANMTDAEQELWRYLKSNRLLGLHFRRQHVLCGFIVDFYCHQALLAIEVDGCIHEHQEEYDGLRDAVLSRQGIRVLRFTNDEILASPIAVVNAIERFADQGLRDNART